MYRFNFLFFFGYLATIDLVSFAAAFWAVTQRSTQASLGGALRDGQKAAAKETTIDPN